jgi:hypothetical protein
MVGTGVASRRYGHGGLGWEGRQRGERSGGGWRNWLGLRALGAYIVDYSRVREKAWGFGRWRSSGCEPPETWRPSTARDRWLREKVLEWGAGSWGSLGRSRAGQGASGAGLLGARVATRASRRARPCGSLLTSGSRKRRARRGHPRKGRASLLFSLAPTSSLRWTPVERSCKGDGAGGGRRRRGRRPCYFFFSNWGSNRTMQRILGKPRESIGLVCVREKRPGGGGFFL